VRVCFSPCVRTTVRVGLSTGSLIRRAGAWFWKRCRAVLPMLRKPWQSYAGAIGDRSMPLLGGGRADHVFSFVGPLWLILR
jgi:hypothetical protein